MHPTGAHTHPGQHTGLGTAIVTLAALAVAASAVAPILNALTNLLQAVAVIAATVVGLAVVTLAAFLVWRLRHDQALARVPALPVLAPGPITAPQPQRPALDRAAVIHLHLHGVPPQEVAAAITRLGDATASSVISEGEPS